MQEENIISWREQLPGGGFTEVALSFAQTHGCTQLWQRICQIETHIKRISKPRHPLNPPVAMLITDDPLSDSRDIHPADVQLEANDSPHARFFDDNIDHNAWNNDAIDDAVFPDGPSPLFLANSPTSYVPSSSTDPAAAAAFVMPEPDRGGVEKFSRIMSDQNMISLPAVRERIIHDVSNGDYVTRLCQVFRTSEEQADLECLSMLYHVVRCLFIVGNNCVLEVLVNQTHLIDIVGCLEYDPEHMMELERKKALIEQRAAGVCPQNSTSAQLAFAEKSTEANPVAHQTEQVSETVYTASADSNQPSSDDVKAQSQCRNGITAASSTSNQNALLEEQSTALKHTPQVAADQKLQSTENVSNHSNTPTGKPRTGDEISSSGNIPDGNSTNALILRTHRNFLERKAAYKQVVPITDQNIVAKIHQNYRVAYIKNVILAGVFDEGVNNALSSVILCNNVDIIMYFISGSTALQELFDRLKKIVHNRKRKQEATVMSGDVGNANATAMLVSPPRRKRRESVMFSDEIGGDGKVSSNSSVKHTPAKGPLRCSEEEDRNTKSTDATTASPVSRTATASMDKTSPVKGGSSEPSSRDPRSEELRARDSTAGDPKSSEQCADEYADLRSILGFLRELCTIVKDQQNPVKSRFHQILLELGALEISVVLLRDEDVELRSKCSDILSAIVGQESAEVRAHIMKNATLQDYSMPRNCIGAGVEERDSNIFGERRDEGDEIVENSAEPRHAADSSIGTEKEKYSDENPSKQGRAAAQDSNAQETPKQKDAEVPQQQTSIENQNEEKDNVDDQGERNTMAETEKVSDTVAVSSEDVSTAKSVVSGKEENVETRWSRKSQTRRETDYPLLDTMVDIICEDETGLALTMLDLMRMLLDPCHMKHPLETNPFLHVFYEKFFLRLLEPVEKAANMGWKKESKQRVCVEHVSHLCDLLSFSLGHHPFRSKYILRECDVGDKIVALMTHKKAHTRLAALRFMRTCVGLRADACDRYIVERRLFDPIMKMYEKNGNRDNLTTSAILDLVCFLVKYKRDLLVKHVVKEYEEVLKPSAKHCTVFEEAKKVCENLEVRQVYGDTTQGGQTSQAMGHARLMRMGGTAESTSGKEITDGTGMGGTLSTGHGMEGMGVGPNGAAAFVNFKVGTGNSRFGPLGDERLEEEGFVNRLGRGGDGMVRLYDLHGGIGVQGVGEMGMDMSRQLHSNMNEVRARRGRGGMNVGRRRDGIVKATRKVGTGIRSQAVSEVRVAKKGEERGMRLSLSKGEANKTDLGGDQGVLLSESSEDGLSAAKRDREEGVEISTSSVREGDAKRRRVEGGAEKEEGVGRGVVE